MRNKPILLLFCKLSVLFIAFAFIVTNADINRLIDAFSRIDLRSCLIAAFIIVFIYFLNSIRLHIMLTLFKAQSRLGKTFTAVLSSSLVSNFTPTTLPSDAVKFAILRREDVSISKVAFAIIADRILTVLSTCLFILASFTFLFYRNNHYVLYLGKAFGLLLLIYACRTIPHIVRKEYLPLISHPFEPYRHSHHSSTAKPMLSFIRWIRFLFTRRGYIFDCILIGLMISLLQGCCFILLYLSFSPAKSFDFIQILIANQIAFFVSALPITLGGYGVREACYQLLAKISPYDSDIAIVASLLMTTLAVLVTVPSISLLILDNIRCSNRD